MNHFLGLLILSLCIALVFALISREKRAEQVRYFFKLLGYMVLGSVAVSWVLYVIVR